MPGIVSAVVSNARRDFLWPLSDGAFLDIDQPIEERVCLQPFTILIEQDIPEDIESFDLDLAQPDIEHIATKSLSR
jgi:hypothetical protein